MIEFLALKQKLSDSFFPVLALVGDDQWLKSRSLEIVEQSLDIQNPQMNIIKLEKPDFESIMLACGTDCFFSPQKLVVVEEFSFPNSQKQQEMKHRLKTFAQSGQNFCCLVFFCNPADTKAFDIQGITVVNCKRLQKYDVQKWILSYAKKQNKTISTQAAGLLAEYCLCDMARLSTELEKLCQYPSNEITVNLIEQLVHKDTEFLIFDLGKAIASKNAKKAYEMMQSLLNHGEEVRSLFTVLYNYFRRLYYIRTNKDELEVQAQYLGVKVGAISIAQSTAMSFKPMELRKILQYFRQCDTKIKLFYNDVDALTTLIFSIIALKT